MSEFTPRNLTLSRNNPRDIYHSRASENKTIIHWGQRKLLLSEIEFITLHYKPDEVPSPIIVYVGAAVGTHIKLLSEMFPMFMFHLYDSAPFGIEESDRINIYNVIFTDEIAQQYAGRNDIFFISDIRTADYIKNEKDELVKRGITQYADFRTPLGPDNLIKEAKRIASEKTEAEVWEDMLAQQRWTMIINPVHALLKFRLPYSVEGKDRLVQYLKGAVYWQTWVGSTSTETRLVPIRGKDGQYEQASWSILDYESWCFHHNTVEREDTSYLNIFTNDKKPIANPELLNDFDSAAEATILKLYFGNNITDPVELYLNVVALSQLITNDLNKYNMDKERGTLDQKRKSIVKTSNSIVLSAFKRNPDPFRNKATPGDVVNKLENNRRPAAPITSGIRKPLSPIIRSTTMVPSSTNIRAMPTISREPTIISLPTMPSDDDYIINRPSPVVNKLPATTSKTASPAVNKLSALTSPSVNKLPALIPPSAPVVNKPAALFPSVLPVPISKPIPSVVKPLTVPSVINKPAPFIVKPLAVPVTNKPAALTVPIVNKPLIPPVVNKPAALTVLSIINKPAAIVPPVLTVPIVNKPLIPPVVNKPSPLTVPIVNKPAAIVPPVLTVPNISKPLAQPIINKPAAITVPIINKPAPFVVKPLIIPPISKPNAVVNKLPAFTPIIPLKK